MSEVFTYIYIYIYIYIYSTTPNRMSQFHIIEKHSK